MTWPLGGSGRSILGRFCPQESVQPGHIRRTADQVWPKRNGHRRQQHGEDDGHQQIVGKRGWEEVGSRRGVQEHEGEFPDLAQCGGGQDPHPQGQTEEQRGAENNRELADQDDAQEPDGRYQVRADVRHVQQHTDRHEEQTGQDLAGRDHL